MTTKREIGPHTLRDWTTQRVISRTTYTERFDHKKRDRTTYTERLDHKKRDRTTYTEKKSFLAHLKELENLGHLNIQDWKWATKPGRFLTRK